MPGGVLAIVPARGGSKSIPRKNLAALAGHPLIAWTIEAALQTKSIERVIVSTDDDRIAAVARAYGAEVPFRRPAELANDEARDLPVFQHALHWLESHENYLPEVVVHLRPTTPLRRPEAVAKAVQMLQDRPDADSVRSVVHPSQNPFKMWRVAATGFLEPLLATEIPEAFNAPRQSLPEVYWHNGYVDVTRRRTVMEMKSMTGQRILPLIGSDEWFDIDTPATLQYAADQIRRTPGAFHTPQITRGVPDRRPGDSRLPDPPRLVVFDLDGPLEDASPSLAGEGLGGAELRDWAALELLREGGIPALVLSSRPHGEAAAHCARFGADAELGTANKAGAFRRYAFDRGIAPESVVYVGSGPSSVLGSDQIGYSIASAWTGPEAGNADLVVADVGLGALLREACQHIVTFRHQRRAS